MHKLLAWFTAPDERRLKPAAGFSLVFIVLILGGIVSIWNMNNIVNSLGWVAHTHEVQSRLQRFSSGIRDVEASFRGYAIVGDDRLLQHFKTDEVQMRESLAVLFELTADNPDQQIRLRELELMAQAYMNAVEEGVELKKQGGGLEAVRQFIQTDKPRGIAEEIRIRVAELNQSESELLESRNQIASRSYWKAIGAGVVIVILSVFAVAAAFYLVQQELAARLAAEAHLREAQVELESRVRQRTIELTIVNKALHEEIGERASAERELRVQEDKLRVYARELERSNLELEQFAGVASHDLQEPLRKIQAFGDRLKAQFKEGLPEQAADYLSRMLGAAGRMRALIDDLLTYSRIARKARSFAPVDLGEIAREVVSDLDERLRASGGRVEVGPLPTVEADKMQMRQLLQNLIANALKFSKPEEAPVVQLAARLDGAPAADGGNWEIDVRDNGIGFENQYRDRIFNMFERLHGRNEYEGTGMGLAICRRIVERHNGTITAMSAPGEGTTFQIHLPVRQPSTGENSEELAQANHHSHG